MNDQYSHDDLNIIYITECILGPSEKSPEYDMLHGNYNSQMLHNCHCSKMCVNTLCKCLQISHGENYEKYYLQGELKYRLYHKSNIFSDYPIIECNSNCKCAPICGNRIVQNGPLEGLVVKMCNNKEKGLGLFSSTHIFKGSFICEYAGELITKTQAIKRSQENEAQGKMNYIFCLNEHTHEGVLQTFVDPSMFGNIGRYINHSCEPNCYIVPVRSEIAIPRLAVFSYVDISPGDEITFCYSSDNNPAVIGKSNTKKKCHCNTKNCKKFLPFENF